MRKIVILLCLSFFFSCVVSHQNAVLYITLANSKSSSCHIYIPGQLKNGSFNIPLHDGRTADYTFKLTRPEFVEIYFRSSDGANSKDLHYKFYLSPGDDLEFNADFNEPEFGVKVSGKGSNNNQPLISAMENVHLSGFQGDTVPYKVINAIKTAQKILQDTLAKYIKLYKPSPTYINDWNINLNYYACDLYNDFKESNNKLYAIQEAYNRNYNKWQKIADSLFRIARLNNDTALTAFHYIHLVSTFLDREKNRLWEEARVHPKRFTGNGMVQIQLPGRKSFTATPKTWSTKRSSTDILLEEQLNTCMLCYFPGQL